MELETKEAHVVDLEFYQKRDQTKPGHPDYQGPSTEGAGLEPYVSQDEDEENYQRDATEAVLGEELAQLAEVLEEEPEPIKREWVDLKALLKLLLRAGDGGEYGTEDLYQLTMDFVSASEGDTLNHWSFRLPPDVALRVRRAVSTAENADDLERLQLLLRLPELTDEQTTRATELIKQMQRRCHHDTLEFSRLLFSSGIRLSTRRVQPGD